MKIKSLTIKNEDLPASIKEAAVATMIGYGKMYELLHKQLWRKSRVSTVNYTIQVNGRDAKPIEHWNIKSPTGDPYSYDGPALGLNQLFMGQSYKDAYDGNLKDGIYHDDCLIQPKSTDLTSNDRMGWYIDGNGDWVEKDEWGNIVTTNVYINDSKYTVETPSGSTEYTLQDATDADGNPYTPTVEYANFSNQNQAYPMYTQYINIPDMSEHGAVLHESTDVGYTRPRGTFTTALIYQAPTALTRVYADGTCIQFVTPSLYQYSQEQTIYYGNVSGSMKYLPLVYLDTGDLVQNRVDFIEQWDDMFELYVHEDSYWYSGLVTILVVVVSIVIAYISAGVLSGATSAELLSGSAMGTTSVAVATIGGAISGIGTVSGDKVFQIVGALVSLGSSVYGSGVKALSTQAMAQGYSQRTAAQIASEATFTQVFKGYTSTVGFSNLLNIGSSAYGIYTTATTKEFTQQTDTTTEDDSVSVIVDDDEDEYSDKVMNLIKL